MQNRSVRDQIRSQYAILVKHVLGHKSKCKVFQLQRAVKEAQRLCQQGMAIGQMILKTEQGEALKLMLQQKIMGTAIAQAASKLASVLMGAVGASALIPGGIIIGVALCAAFAIYQAGTAEQQPTIGDEVTKALVKENLEKIKAFLKAYQTCYQNEDKFKNYYVNMLNQAQGSNSQSVNKIHDLMEHREYIFSKIKDQEFTKLSTDAQINIVELYYQVTKALIEIVSIAWNKDIADYLGKLQNQHKKVKQILINQINKQISIDNNEIKITTGQKAKFYLEIEEAQLNEKLFSQKIFDQIFKCPVTQYKIDEIYDLKTWITEKKTNNKIPSIDFKSSDQSFSYIGNLLTKYPSSNSAANNRIRKIAPVQNTWSCYYENLTNKSGHTDNNYNNPPAVIDLDRTLVIFIEWNELKVLTSDNQKQTICKIPKIESTPHTNYCIELFPDEIITELRFKGTQSFCFVKKSFKEELINKKQLKSSFQGHIISIKNRTWIGYGAKYRNFLNLTKGYNFHGKSGTDEQKLIFEAVHPIEYFQDRKQLKVFTCRITNQYDRTMYMVREDRNTQSTDFGNNTGGGQVITVSFVKKISANNEYLGTLSVAGFKVYESDSGNLECTRGAVPKTAQLEFQIFVNQV